MTADRISLSPTQLDNTSPIPITVTQLSNRRKSITAPIDHAVKYSKRELSRSPMSTRQMTANLTTDTLTSRLTHRIGQQPMITLPFSYHVGGALSWNDPTYIQRAADSELFSAIEHNRFAYVFGPRQMGKSSLRIHTRHRLIQQGYRCVTIQANQLDQGCSAFIAALWANLNLSKIASLRDWLNATAALSVSERLHRFSREMLTGNDLKAPTVIFIDEIDALLETPFLADLLIWIQQCYQHRLTETAYQNLHFVVLGTTTTSALIEASHRSGPPPHPAPAQAAQAQAARTHSPVADLFANGCNISLPAFQLVETFCLHQGFEEKIDDPIMLLKAIFKWTQGQPFLTQKLCHIASSLIDTLVQPSTQPIVLSTKTINCWIDNLVRSHLIKNWTTQDDPIHFRAMRDRLVYSPNSRALLTLYKAIYTGTPVRVNDSELQTELLLTGMVSTTGNCLQVANPIYREVFAIKSALVNHRRH